MNLKNLNFFFQNQGSCKFKESFTYYHQLKSINSFLNLNFWSKLQNFRQFSEKFAFFFKTLKLKLIYTSQIFLLFGKYIKFCKNVVEYFRDFKKFFKCNQFWKICLIWNFEKIIHFRKFEFSKKIIKFWNFKTILINVEILENLSYF